MDDIQLKGTLDDLTIIVTPLSNGLYRMANAHNIGLGGSEGYFICSTITGEPEAGLNILAKAANFDAAELIFNALTGAST